MDFQADLENTPENIRDTVQTIILTPCGDDGITFDPQSVTVTRIVEDADYAGIRAVFKGNLGNAKIFMQADFGFGDRIIPDSRMIDFPVLIDDFPGPRLKCYPPETVIAQKFQAMVKLGEINSRIRDFYDIWFLMQTCEFDGAVLAEAVQATFDHRRTSLLPDLRSFLISFASIEEKETLFRNFIKRSQINDAPTTLLVLAAEIERFLNPVCSAIINNENFNRKWAPDSGWS